MKKPAWINTSVDMTSFQDIFSKIRQHDLHVVCFEASCPNIGTCFHRKTATFLILGEICTRGCKFCGITQGDPAPIDPNEPKNVAKLLQTLNLKHVVITSVTRDDLPDQGVSQFVETIREIRKLTNTPVIEVLIPDFQGDTEILNQLIAERPEIINHNIETIPRLYPEVRPQADYSRSLEVLEYIKEQESKIFTKSGFMIGLDETKAEIIGLLRDLKEHKVDIVTIGQYLRPSKAQLAVQKYYTPEEFKEFEKMGRSMGFLYMVAAPLVRSSFNAIDFSQQFMT